MRKEDGDYGYCPTECKKVETNVYDPQRDYCSGCPKQKHMKMFREDVKEAWVKWFGHDHSFDFDNMMDQLNYAVNCEDLPANKMTVTAQRLVSIIQSARDKAF